MKNILTIALLLTTLLSTSCRGQSKAIGDAPLNLATFNFDTKISTLYPEKNKSKDYKGYYEIKGVFDSQLVETDTTFVDEFSENQKAIGVEYHQQSSTSVDTMATFGKQIFQKLNVATTLDGKVKIISAVADEITIKQSNKFVKDLIKIYGNPRLLKSSWNEKFTLLEWTTKSRIIRYVSAYNDESNTLKIVIDEGEKTFKEGVKEPHFEGYLFIINPTLKKEVFGKLKTGDFVYVNAKSE